MKINLNQDTSEKLVFKVSYKTDLIAIMSVFILSYPFFKIIERSKRN